MYWKELPLSEYKISCFIGVLRYKGRNYNRNSLFFLGFLQTVVNFALDTHTDKCVLCDRYTVLFPIL